jgi:dCMP deaminase
MSRTGMEWDEWYHLICKDIAKKSQCLSRKIGAILVRDKGIVSQGYNGPPRDVRPCDERWFVDEEIRKAANFKHQDTTTKAFESFYDVYLKGKCPRYIPEMGFKSGEGLEWCVAGHAERNALNNAARFGIETKGTIMYMDCGIPCTPCLVEIINSGVEEIVVSQFTIYDKSALYILKESSLKVRLYKHLCEHENFLQNNDLRFTLIEGFCPDCGGEY